MAATSFIGGRFVDRLGRRAPTTLGLLLMTIGVAPIEPAGSDITLSLLALGLSFVGLGLGLASLGLQISAAESVASSQAGSASGLFSTSRYLVSIIGLAIMAAVPATVASTFLSTRPAAVRNQIA